jgi:hypothetical protein
MRRRRLRDQPLGQAMRIARISLLVLVSAVSLQPGCVAPGSSIGHLSIRGTLTADRGQPLPNEELQFLLPAAYGLGGLDLVANKPEDFGHRDQIFTATSGLGGEFSCDLGAHVYHRNVWLFPPLGGFPRHPPAPFVLVRISSIPGEYYAVQTRDGKFKIFTDDGDELSLDRAHLSGLEASGESGSGEHGEWTAGVIDLQVRVE